MSTKRFDDMFREGPSPFDVRVFSMTNTGLIIFVLDNGLLKLPGGRSKPYETDAIAARREYVEEAYNEETAGTPSLDDFLKYSSEDRETHERVCFLFARAPDTRELRTEGDEGERVVLIHPEALWLEPPSRFHQKHLELAKEMYLFVKQMLENPEPAEPAS